MAFFVLYLLMVLESLQSYLFGFAIICGLGSLVVTIVRALMRIEVEDIKIMPLSTKIAIGGCIVASLLGHMIPSKQDMAIIAAGGITYNIATSDKAAELGNKSIELLSKKLDQMIEDPVKATKDAKAVVEEVKK